MMDTNQDAANVFDGLPARSSLRWTKRRILDGPKDAFWKARNNGRGGSLLPESVSFQANARIYGTVHKKVNES